MSHDICISHLHGPFAASAPPPRLDPHHRILTSSPVVATHHNPAVVSYLVRRANADFYKAFARFLFLSLIPESSWIAFVVVPALLFSTNRSIVYLSRFIITMVELRAATYIILISQ
ncbi:hypothetical protein M9X92_006581 [Pyricularia oryzae]|nr:hypothetical protein M9X92_006581 [Pyricularia oryzae]